MQNSKVEDNLHDKPIELGVANERKETDKKRLFLKTTKSQHSYSSINAAIMDDSNNKVSEVDYNTI